MRDRIGNRYDEKWLHGVTKKYEENAKATTEKKKVEEERLE